MSRARGSQMTSHTSIIGHGRRKRGGFRWEQHGAPLDAFSRLACQSELELTRALCCYPTLADRLQAHTTAGHRVNRTCPSVFRFGAAQYLPHGTPGRYPAKPHDPEKRIRAYGFKPLLDRQVHPCPLDSDRTLDHPRSKEAAREGHHPPGTCHGRKKRILQPKKGKL